MAEQPVIEQLCPHCGCMPEAIGEVHKSDCYVFTEPYAIARELAEHGPYALLTPSGWYWCPQPGCHGRAVLDAVSLAAPAAHEPSCLWRRAKALYPD